MSEEWPTDEVTMEAWARSKAEEETMIPKPLEEEVAELEREPEDNVGYRHDDWQRAVSIVWPRLIADWRARGEKIEELKELEKGVR